MKKNILIINEKSNIAISTLWTPWNKVLEELEKYLYENEKLNEDEVDELKNKIGIIGTTYTSAGINYMLHTLSQNPQIDTLILYGADLSTSGETIYDVFGRKNYKNKNIIFNENEIKETVDTIKLIDLRKDFEERNIGKLVKSIVENYRSNAKPVRNRIEVKMEELKNLYSWPFPISGFQIYETSVFRAWVKILDSILKFGSMKFSEYEEPQKEVLNVMVTINGDLGNYEIEDDFLKYFSRKDFENHISQVLNPEKPKSVEYTYGERIFKHRFGKNQLEYLVKKLSEAPYSRRALIVSWDHEIDQKTKNPPCIIGIQGIITGNYYSHTAIIRSNDMYAAWPLNIVGQIELAKKIVEEINKRCDANYSLLNVTTISISAHIYQHDFEKAERVVRENSNKLGNFIPDPRGNFLIYVEDNAIKVEHRSPDNLYIVNSWKGKGFKELYEKLKKHIFAFLPEHAFYLSQELKKASEKLEQGKEYIQDSA